MTDDPFKSGQLILQMEVKKYCDKKDIDKLKKLSMHCIENAWHKIEFCEVERGIHGATPVEMLHAIQHGLHEYLIASFFDQRKEKKQKKETRKNREYLS